MFKFILLSLVTWKIWLFVFLAAAWVFVPLRTQFLGGGLEHYLRFPWLWSWSNFDGEHYLAISQHGYGLAEQAFFPAYPLLIRILSWPLRGDIYFLQFSALFISHLSFALGLFGLWKLLSLDFKKSIVELTIIFILVFPTAFYFVSAYTESLFLALSVWSIYFARKGSWFWGGILGAFASSARFTGIILVPVLFIEFLLQQKGNTHKSLLPLLRIAIVPLGLLGYVFYLLKTTGDPIAFFHSLSFFGEQRSTILVPLPQVFWRYLKMLFDVPKTDPLFFTILLESLTAVLFLLAGIISFFKLRFSYSLWLFLGYLLPTFSGSFSSLPRYVLPLFPAFLLSAIFFDRQNLFVKVLIISFLFVILGITTAFFVRGYWVA